MAKGCAAGFFYFKNQNAKCKIVKIIQLLKTLSAGFHNFEFLFLIFEFPYKGLDYE